jgi:hypothetical protein
MTLSRLNVSSMVVSSRHGAPVSSIDQCQKVRPLAPDLEVERPNLEAVPDHAEGFSACW